MSTATYKTSLETAIAELTKLMDKRESIETQLDNLDQRIATVRFAAEGLCGICDIDPAEMYPHLFPENTKPNVGFTDAVRAVFHSYSMGTLLTPVQVRDDLQKKGFDLSSYKNPLASIHTILKRLETAGEIDSQTDEGRAYYSRASALKSVKQLG